MTRFDQGTGRLSLRNSILVWVAGIVIGWGCAVVLFYQLIRDSGAEGGFNTGGTLVAEANEGTGLAEIAPAAGPQAKVEAAGHELKKTEPETPLALPEAPANAEPASAFGRIEVDRTTTE